MKTNHDEENLLPLDFIRSLSKEDWCEIFSNEGYLNQDQCAKLWRMTDRQSIPPVSLQLFVRQDDIELIWPPKRKRRKHRRY